MSIQELKQSDSASIKNHKVLMDTQFNENIVKLIFDFQSGEEHFFI